MGLVIDIRLRYSLSERESRDKQQDYKFVANRCPRAFPIRRLPERQHQPTSTTSDHILQHLVRKFIDQSLHSYQPLTMPPKKATAAASQKKAAAAPAHVSYRGQSLLPISTQRCRIHLCMAGTESRTSTDMNLQI